MTEFVDAQEMFTNVGCPLLVSGNLEPGATLAVKILHTDQDVLFVVDHIDDDGVVWSTHLNGVQPVRLFPSPPDTTHSRFHHTAS